AIANRDCAHARSRPGKAREPPLPGSTRLAGRSLANLAACLTMAALVLRTVSIRGSGRGPDPDRSPCARRVYVTPPLIRIRRLQATRGRAAFGVAGLAAILTVSSVLLQTPAVGRAY